MSYKREAIEEADLIVITNPKKLVVGLRYDSKRDNAPVVVYVDYYKGFAGYFNDNQEKIIINSILARMLYNNVDMGEQIPRELYQAVAEAFTEVTMRKRKYRQELII